MTPAPPPQDKLVYSSTPWKIYEQDAGMGERDYAVMVDDVFYCRTDDSQTAMKIVEAIRSRPHTPSPQNDYRDLFVSDLIKSLEWDAKNGNPELFKAVTMLRVHYNEFAVEGHDATIRNATLDELHSWGYYRYRNSLVKTNGINEYTVWSEHIESLRIRVPK